MTRTENYRRSRHRRAVLRDCAILAAVFCFALPVAGMLGIVLAN